MPLYPQYAPDFKIKIDGENLPPAIRASVMSVRYDNGSTEMDRVELQLADPNLVVVHRWMRRGVVQQYCRDEVEIFADHRLCAAAAVDSYGVPNPWTDEQRARVVEAMWQRGQLKITNTSTD